MSVEIKINATINDPYIDCTVVQNEKTTKEELTQLNKTERTFNAIIRHLGCIQCERFIYTCHARNINPYLELNTPDDFAYGPHYTRTESREPQIYCRILMNSEINPKYRHLEPPCTQLHIIKLSPKALKKID